MRLRTHVPLLGWLLAALLLMAAGGCGRATTVSGTITYRGRPVTNGSVIFVGNDKTAHAGVIAADGTYTIDGLLPGGYSIAVLSRDPSRGRSTVRGHKPETSGRAGAAQVASKDWFPLPAKFESAATSGLSCELGSGKVKYDVELK